MIGWSYSLSKYIDCNDLETSRDRSRDQFFPVSDSFRSQPFADGLGLGLEVM